MSAVDSTGSRLLAQPLRGARIMLPLYAGTLFLSAFLLFSIQPFFTKMLLPRLGGSPGVWSVAMVFFQGMLLLGYLYAHLVSRHCRTRVGAIIHGCVLLAAFLALPIAIPAGWETPPDQGQSIWLLGLFTAAVGAPFFAVSANSALLQAWFSRSGHPHADDPYFLYGSSNVGSFASLILYIVLIEPLFSIPTQSGLWTGGYAIMAMLIAACAWFAIAAPEAARTAHSQDAAAAAPANRLQVLKWIGLGFVPSGLLVAVTAHISLDVAAAPFLWVVPLALFLLTFVIVFRRQPLIGNDTLARIVPVFGALTLMSLYGGDTLPVWATIAVHLGFFFVAALRCHGVLFSLRPSPDRLTGFYLAMSFGGVLGGAFASLLAPVTFDWVAEYPLLIVATMLIQPGLAAIPARAWLRIAVLVLGVSVALVAAGSPGLVDPERLPGLLALLLMGVAIATPVALMRSPKVYAAMLVLLVPVAFVQANADTDLFRERSFFGISRVVDVADSRYRVMMHGTTIHGAMELQDEAGKAVTGKPEPLTYYHRTGGIAAAIKAAQKQHGGTLGHVGAVGLGAGSVACYARPGEAWTFFEIDQSVVKAARDPALFRFLSDCGPTIPVVMGDARLTLGHQPDGVFDLLLIDAFSSDSITAHLMTAEALKLYRAKTKTDGLLVFHISNRYLELESVLAALAAREGLQIRVGSFDVVLGGSDGAAKSKSRVAVMAADRAAFGEINGDPRWTTPSAGTTAAWTDDFSNIFTALMRRAFQG